MSTDEAAEFLRDIGQRVARQRAARGWTQNELAARAAIPAGSIGAVERGAGSVDVVRLWRIARGLGVPLVDLIPDAGMVRPIRRSRPRGPVRPGCPPRG